MCVIVAVSQHIKDISELHVLVNIVQSLDHG